MNELAQKIIGKTIVFEARDPKHWYNRKIDTFEQVLTVWKNKAEFLMYGSMTEDGIKTHSVQEWRKEQLESLLDSGTCAWTYGVIRITGNTYENQSK